MQIWEKMMPISYKTETQAEVSVLILRFSVVTEKKRKTANCYVLPRKIKMLRD